jgi:hypothetical protein
MDMSCALTWTTIHKGCSSTDHGGGKRRGAILRFSGCPALNNSIVQTRTIMARGNLMQTITLRYPTVTCPGCKRPMTPSPPLPVSEDTELCDVSYTCEDCGATTTRTIKIEK